jgi:hypothetical protein
VFLCSSTVYLLTLLNQFIQLNQAIMKKRILCIVFLVAFVVTGRPQVAINTDGSLPDASSMLDIKSTLKGLLIPRMTTAQRVTIASPSTGLLVFDTDLNEFVFRKSGTWSQLQSGTSLWTADSGVTYLANSGDNVGIGTSSPGFKLTVSGDIKSDGRILADYGTTTNPTFRFGDGIETSGFSSPSPNALAFLTNGTTRMFINSSGNIGIGTNSPGQKLSLANGNLALTNTGTVGELMFYEPSSGGSNYTSIKAQLQDVNNTLTLPKDPGTNGQFLSTNSSGVMSWAAIPLADRIQDADGDTKVQVEKNTDEDKIRFDLGGIEKWVIDSSRLEPRNSGGSTFIGEEAGQNDDLTNNYNVCIGRSAGKANTTGSKNVIIGAYALSNAISGRNTAIGYQAMQYVKHWYGDWWNTAVGCQALSGLSANENLGYSNTAVGDQALYSNNGADMNTAVGHKALFSNTVESNNTAVGYSALYNNTGPENTAVGSYTLFSNTSGLYNTAIGDDAMYANTTGSNNTACGAGAMAYNLTGSYNTSQGYTSLLHNTSGSYNTAIGYNAAKENTTASYNTALGTEAMLENTISTWNTVVGAGALHQNTTGDKNTVIGKDALYDQGYSNGGVLWNSYNTAVGVESLKNNWDGVFNTAVGHHSLYLNYGGERNTAIGYEALASNTSGYWNTAIGCWAGPTVSGLIRTTALGYNSHPTSSAEAVVGDAYTYTIGGAADWSIISDERFKTDISESVPGLAFITKLRPVTYRKDWPAINSFFNIPQEEIEQMKDIVAARPMQSGFLAQEVCQAAKEAGYDFEGVIKPANSSDYYRLRYGLFVVPLVKAVQELSEQNEALRKENEEIRKRLEELEKKVGR